MVDWSDGRWKGRDRAGFVAPGIGYGEIVCGTQQWHVRFHPSDLGRETSMMLWTYKEWDRRYREKAIREAIHTQFGGTSFQEGLNKWSPDRYSTGEYEGLITDRGVLEAPFAESLAPPTRIHLTWNWDLSDLRKGRCRVDATLRTENADATPPLARSAQIVWRGEQSAAGRDRATVSVPGLGAMALVCEPRPEGRRTVTVDTPSGAAIITRQGGEDASVEVPAGPVQAELPNNGQLKIVLGSASVLVTSRWKVNDPRPMENSCRVAAQAVVE